MIEIILCENYVGGPFCEILIRLEIKDGKKTSELTFIHILRKRQDCFLLHNRDLSYILWYHSYGIPN